LRDFPRTHSLIRLLKLAARAYDNEKEINKFLTGYRETINDLEEAYLTSRYLPVEFYPEQIQKMRNFVESLLKLMSKYENS